MDGDLQDGVRIEVTGEFDRHGLEALRLELQDIAKRYGVKISQVRVEKIDAGC